MPMPGMHGMQPGMMTMPGMQGGFGMPPMQGMMPPGFPFFMQPGGFQGLNLPPLPGMGMPGMGVPQAAAPPVTPSAPQPRAVSKFAIDPDVEALCDHFKVEERICRRLNEAMKGREATFKDDIDRLWDVLKSARSPGGLLQVKIREIENGVFIGKANLNRDAKLKQIVEKFNLDDSATCRLAEAMLVRCRLRKEQGKRDTRDHDLDAIDAYLECARRPDSMVMQLLNAINSDQEIPEPPKEAQAGSYKHKKEHGDRETQIQERRARERGGKDKRSRSNSRRRSRSRSRSRSRKSRSRKRRR